MASAMSAPRDQHPQVDLAAPGAAGGAIEWADVAPGVIVVATGDGSWLHRPAPVWGWDPFTQPMQTLGSLETTANLLDGALAAGRGVGPDPASGLASTLIGYVWWLVGAYRTTHATPALMEEASRRFAEAGRDLLAEYAAQKAREEAGHHALALRDLRALGYRAEGLVEALVPMKSAAMVAYFAASVRADDPVGCVGYVYALERLAATIGAETVKRVEGMIPAGIRATRCLRVHSSVGADPSHVRDGLRLVAALSAEERVRVATACFQTARTIFGRAEEPGDAELRRRVSAFRDGPSGPR